MLDKSFIERYEPDTSMGFGDMSYMIMNLKYSWKTDEGHESWRDIVERVVNGAFDLINQYSDHTFSSKEIKAYSEQMFDDIYHMRILPAGRPLCNLGTSSVHERGLGEKLYNCTGVSMETVGDPVKALKYVMDMSMLEVGVGVSLSGVVPRRLYTPKRSSTVFTIPDTREGWVEALELLLNSYLHEGMDTVLFDYSAIRPKGSIIRGNGGIHEGYKPLEHMLESIREVLSSHDRLGVRPLADVINLIGDCVVNGGQRRSALLLLGDYSNDDFMDLKNYDKNPERAKFGYTSNNSPFLKPGQDYSDLLRRIKKGEDIGAVWLDNARTYARMGDDSRPPDAITVFNPCVEIGLEDFELCNLIEFNPNAFEVNDHEGQNKALESAVLLAKAISLAPLSWKESREVVSRNRRFGISQSGAAQYLYWVGEEVYTEELKAWYDHVSFADTYFSRMLGINASVRTTTVKPSGTLSKIMGVTSGVHFATSRYMIRRVEVPTNHPLRYEMVSRGYSVIPSAYKRNVHVIEFPIKQEGPTIDEVSLEDQFRLAAMMQKYWADNAVSVTFTFTEENQDQLDELLPKYDTQLKCASFLKRIDGLWQQQPEEPITEERYLSELKQVELRKDIVHFKKNHDEWYHIPDSYCTTDLCEVRQGI